MSTAAAAAAQPAVVSPPGRGHGRRVARWLRAAALGAAVAGGLHLVAAVDHLEAGELAVGFFLATGFAQLGLAAWLLMSSWTDIRPGPRLVTSALAATVGLIGLYLVAHTTSLLDAFAVHDAAAHGGHGGAAHLPGFDPVTGVDLSEGVAVSSPGPVAMAGEVGGARHAPGFVGQAAVAAELLLVAALAALQPAAWRRRTVDAVLALGVLAWVLWFTGVLA
ncbi:hypothetical protein E9529_18595 [Blastococcus sp. KM273128]|uniref:hypothetical protein n=1 Tax=Blastococcus sp. KM273128 TaxID=2570314 RepID=UPI001F3F5F7A|nr:hypothetical protein [Blastococcus sp. KM273128]MCF6746246.1 hypothetical protein [Blastococcus sp. KM273128]